MQRLKTITLTPAAADDNGICLTQTPAAGGVQSLSLTGAALVTAGVATMDMARRVIITCAGDEHARTFTVYGTDRLGRSISEAVAGVTPGVASTLKDFKTVTHVTVDDNTAGAVIVGTSGVLSSQWIPMDRVAVYDVGFHVIPTGTINYTVQHTKDDPFPQANINSPSDIYLHPIAHTTVAAKTDEQAGNYSESITALRVTINSFTVGASLRFQVAPGFGEE